MLVNLKSFLMESDHAHALCQRRFMILDPLTFRINDFILRVAIFKLFSRLCRMGIHATISELALTLSLVENATRNLTKGRPIFID